MTTTTISTPWGVANHVAPVGTDGILRVDTPSHGGYFVPDALLHRIPAAHRAYADRVSGSANWYEEDCAWACVAVAFPEHFEGTARGWDGEEINILDEARRVIARWVDTPSG